VESVSSLAWNTHIIPVIAASAAAGLAYSLVI
jgi:hypothetical protein